MMRPARIRQPGPEQQPRIVAVETRGRSIKISLQPGVQLLEGVRRGFADAGFRSGVVELGVLALAPMAYVMPALSKDGANAAFYSDVFRPDGVTRLEAGALTFGLRDGAPFFHCHALWREADGKRSGGHILPEATVVAGAATVEAFGIDAMFEGAQDAEINFKIFGPVAASVARDASASSVRALAVRLRPNIDVIETLESIARTYGLQQARIRGGVGSTIGARFADGTVVENFATEIFVRHGHIGRGVDGSPLATLDIDLVDYTGQIARGRLVKGDNPVLMTLELVLEET